MWDIKIVCSDHSYYMDIFKAYFIVNNIDYSVIEKNIIFYVDTVDKFFKVVGDLNIFYHEHRKQGMESIDFVVSVDAGNYCVIPARYAEY